MYVYLCMWVFVRYNDSRPICPNTTVVKNCLKWKIVNFRGSQVGLQRTKLNKTEYNYKTF